MNGKLRILLIDDDQDSFLITRELLSQVSSVSCELDWVDSYEAGLEALKRGGYDACLLDYRLGPRDGLELLHEAQAEACRAPIIMLTGQGEHAIDLQAMKAGAADYLGKQELDASRLERSIRYAIERQQWMVKLREANDVLDERVRERTAELAAVNASLLAETEERRQAEAALKESEAALRVALSHVQESLNQNEVLFRELQHRVKNNLQLIISLLSLQSNRLRDRAAQELFKECQQRVRAIALVHQRLYKAPNLAGLDLPAFFRDLVQNLIRCYCVNSGKIAMKVAVDDVAIAFDDLVPCTLIVNELVCNALKYAFPDRRSGEVCVEIRRTGGQIQLVVADNGVGIPLSGEPGTMPCDGTGRQIVQALVEQLSGKLEWSGGHGTTATITFPETR